jgi:hypothetical protein
MVLKRRDGAPARGAHPRPIIHVTRHPRSIDTGTSVVPESVENSLLPVRTTGAERLVRGGLALRSISSRPPCRQNFPPLCPTPLFLLKAGRLLSEFVANCPFDKMHDVPVTG